ncbi:uncharacterized protein LOC120638539 [Ornithorhynchus anatinus]|uniref:uncharacterized protein LOC120638539 n=1 Tax=Ornithorhynchus anatinus TaxID=9258 RepID=UPI0019D41698|nr:uncharacterized protein LOC120638539 [Ornithorhynchus anatinus]
MSSTDWPFSQRVTSPTPVKPQLRPRLNLPTNCPELTGPAKMILPQLIVVVSLCAGANGQRAQNRLDTEISRKMGKTVSIDCKADLTNFRSNYIHWYYQRAGQAPERIPYVSKDDKVSFDQEKSKTKFETQKRDSSYYLRIHKLVEEDAGMYYCAYWDVTTAIAAPTCSMPIGCFLNKSLPPPLVRLQHHLQLNLPFDCPEPAGPVRMILPQLIIMVSLWADTNGQRGQNHFGRVVSNKKGNSVFVNCQMDLTKDITYIHWYRQRADQAPERILYITKDNQVTFDQKKFETKFVAQRKVSSCHLRIPKLDEEDAGMYYCAYWDDTVTESPQQPHKNTFFLLHPQLVLAWFELVELVWLYLMKLNPVKDNGIFTIMSTIIKALRSWWTYASSLVLNIMLQTRQRHQCNRMFNANWLFPQMILLQLIMVASLWAGANGQIGQNQLGAVISKKEGRSVTVDCKANFKSDYIHWYLQGADQVPKRILYIYKDKVFTDQEKEKTKYEAPPKDSSYHHLRIHRLVEKDSGMYYCAYWNDTVTGNIDRLH